MARRLLFVAGWTSCLYDIALAADAIKVVESWYGLRGAVLGDVAVFEGGFMSGNNGVSDESITQPPNRMLFNLSLCQGFDISMDNSLDVLDQTDENAGNGAAIWVGGGMFATDYEWYTFGGLPTIAGTGVSVTQFNVFEPPTMPGSWEVGATIWTENTNDGSLKNVSWYVTNGAYASDPARSKAWWVNGMQAQGGGPIDFTSGPNDPTIPNTTSKMFIEVDMASPGAAEFKNLTWPAETVQARAEGGLVWLPYGKAGILMYFGGASYPADLQGSGLVPNDENNVTMTEIAIYDIASESWSVQNTLGSGSPPATAAFCTVVATAQDNSGHFVYVYGGYDGSYSSTSGSTYDTVWVLAVPAMQWVQVSTGTPTHARTSHFCYKAGSQMISVGGAGQYLTSLTSSWLDVFDLNKLEWTGTYSQNWTEYEVPANIIQAIGVGSSTGGFAEVPSALSPTLSTLLSATMSPSPTVSLKCSSSSSTGTGKPNPKPNKWKIPVIAVCSVVGALIVGAMIWFLCFRRRRGSTEATGANSRNIFNWRQGVVGASTNKSVVSEETTVTPVGDYFGPHKTGARETINESYELHNTGSPAPAYYSPPQLVSPGSPQSATSYGNTRSSAHEVEASSARHGWSNHPAHPPSHIDGDFIIAGTASVSGQSGHASHYRTVGQMSPYEMAHDRSEERLAQPDDVDLNDTRTDQFEASSAKMPMIARKPVSRAATPMQSPTGHRPTHNRHNSSLSSGIPDLPSPSNTESKRQSHMIESLPDSSPRSGPLRSPFREHFDEQRQPLRRRDN